MRCFGIVVAAAKRLSVGEFAMKGRTLEPALPSPPTWLVVAAAATSAAIVMGLRQAMGLYLKPVTSEFGLSREAFGLSIAFANIIWGIAAPVLGALTDHYGSRAVIIGGLLATAAGLITLQIASNEDLLLLSGLFLGLGVAGAGIGAAVGIVARTTATEDQSSAVASIGLGSAIGIVVALPVAHILIDEIGWKQSLSVFAAAALAVIPLAWVVRDRPDATTRVPKSDFVTALSEACCDRSFWFISAGFFVCGFHVTFFSTYLPAYVADHGLPASAAVIALVVLGLGNVLGMYLAGQSAKILPARHGLALLYLARALVFVGFLVLPITSTTVIVLSAVLGLLWLSTVPLTSMLVVKIYGPGWTTMLFGVVFFFHQVGSFVGGWLGGLIFDQFKSYDIMWWISVALGVVAAMLQWPVRETAIGRAEAESDLQRQHVL